MINFKNLNKQQDVIVIFGATASGKSDLALKLAQQIDGVIINADSSQIYANAPILSNLPSVEEFSQAPHKLFAYLCISQASSVADWLKLCALEINNARLQNKTPIVVGGSGMYISALLYGLSDIPSNKEMKQKSINLYNEIGYDKFFYIMQKIDPKFTENNRDAQRLIRAYEVYLISSTTFSYFQNLEKKKYVDANFINIFINPEREQLYKKINDRTLIMFKRELLAEASKIYAITQNNMHLKKILGLQEVIANLNNELSLEQTIHIIQQKTRNYAKRQITWFNNQIKEKNILKNGNDIFYKK
jgi:tRNA dimethylallyltransferase